ncbi:hypothetical protein Tco_0205230 [Tanacetum coccineum]
MNYILQRIPNDIYNSVDACSDAKQIWNRIKRLMQGSDISQQERHSRVMNEFGKFVAVEGESLTSMYERLSTLINVMDRYQVRPPAIAANTMFLNSLQLEWSKYVTKTRQQYILKTKEYDALFDHLSQFEPHVNASKAKKVARNHDPLALIQGDAQEDKLTTAMMLLARAITQCYSTPTNNRLRLSSNTRNQPVVQDGRVDIQSKNVGYIGKQNKNAGRQNRNQATNAGNAVIMIARIKPIDDKSDAKPTYDYEFISEVNASKVDMINGLLSKSDHELRHHEKLETIIHTSADDQIDFDIWKRIIKKRTKTKLKMTKPSTEWKSVKRRSQIEAKSQPSQSQVNPDKVEVKRRVKRQNTTLGTKFAKSLKLDFKDLKTKVVFITIGAKSANSLSYIPQGLNLQDHLYHRGTSSANPAKFYTTRTYGVIT